MEERFGRLATRAWEIANKMMEDDWKEFGWAWTAIAQLLDELSGRNDWGILKVLENEEV